MHRSELMEAALYVYPEGLALLDLEWLRRARTKVWRNCWREHRPR